MWIFVQSTGRMWHAHAGGKVVLEIGYAGRGKGENNPEMQFAEDCGPLPQGRYRLQEPETWHNMSHCFHLDPAPGNAMGGRCGFLIHAGMRDGSHTASHGCIVLSFDARSKIAASDDRDLLVQRDDP
jgi:hypothetical protein